MPYIFGFGKGWTADFVKLLKEHKIFKTLVISVTFSCMLFMSGCATVARHAVPPHLFNKAEIADMPGIRTFYGVPNPSFQKDILESFKQEGKDDYPISTDGVKTYSFLFISGGAASGAYGAGLLKGWSENGSRPVFKVVTGVSTGALTAPLAFLGKDYDGLIEDLYTNVSTKDLMKFNGPFRILFGDSLASNKPLEKYIKKIVSPETLKKMAAEHMRGRRLYVGTTNMDAQRFVVWNMGAIACKGDEKLFERILLASAAIPVTFPPVFFHVKAGGMEYDEMHSDGGTSSQVFSLYKMTGDLRPAAAAAGIDIKKIRAEEYIIRNGYVTSNWREVKDDIGSIVGRTLDTIIDRQAIGDLYKIYLYAKERGEGFHLAYIPPDLTPEGKEIFDKKEMRRLFDRGYQDAVKGYNWHSTPPDFGEDEK